MCGTCEYDLTRQKGPRRCEKVKGPGWTQCHQQGSLQEDTVWSQKQASERRVAVPAGDRLPPEAGIGEEGSLLDIP